AEEGIMLLKSHVDTLLVISNDKLRHQFGNLKMREAFAKADNVLATAAKCITDVINSTGQINVDFADVCTVMKNGGVAILGSAACEGEDRAQKAIEEALSSPLLNDNDIRGAKWILININSSEGEHEFTMDEVEIIQTHLLSQAGEHTDVILGLGYDNSLGNKVGITLIATGFEHKDPFVKKVAVKQEPKEERILMTLGSEPSSGRRQPVAEVQQPDLLAPSLVDEEAMLQNPALHITEEEEEEVTAPLQYFELGAKEPKEEVKEEEQTPSLQLKFKEEPKADRSEIDAEKLEWEKKKQALEDKADALRKTILGGQPSKAGTSQNASSSSAGGYLARPSSIYSEPKAEASSSKPAGEPAKATGANVDQSEELNMQLVMRNEAPAENVPVVNHPSQAPQAEADGMRIQDEASDEKQRASERLQKLRNLSFNLNAADPNNEFEAVPAYIRRNMELQNSSSAVENFYSNYTVKSDGKNKATISTINTFLDGKKPD
ncbi:MAG TPA: cell division protein FtsZ, partial [Flavisolibacter sp.]|nr:cell division protein FtsZ [Flavisolibacter sp.]